MSPCLQIEVETERRHVYVRGDPVPVLLFAPDSWLMRMVRDVCGADAVMDAKLGREVGARVAFAARGEGPPAFAELFVPDRHDKSLHNAELDLPHMEAGPRCTCASALVRCLVHEP